MVFLDFVIWSFLNQVRAGRVFVCPRPKLLMTSGVMWRDMDLIWLVKQVLQLLYGNCSRYH